MPGVILYSAVPLPWTTSAHLAWSTAAIDAVLTIPPPAISAVINVATLLLNSCCRLLQRLLGTVARALGGALSVPFITHALGWAVKSRATVAQISVSHHIQSAKAC